jgi:hypothetical protein
VTRTNNFNALVDFTGNKYFKELDRNGKKISFCRIVGFVRPSPGSKTAEGVRFLAYGPLAELVFASVQKGTRAFIIAHLQTRVDTNGHYFAELVIEDIQYISGENHEAAEKKMEELIASGVLHSSSPDELKINIESDLGDEENGL